jgi:hypothetical protein
MILRKEDYARLSRWDNIITSVLCEKRKVRKLECKREMMSNAEVGVLWPKLKHKGRLQKLEKAISGFYPRVSRRNRPTHTWILAHKTHF